MSLLNEIGLLGGLLRGLGYRTMRDYTWATKPSAAAVPGGTRIRVTDVGISPGARFVSDGTGWRPDGPIVLARSAVTVSVTGTVNETALATISVPAGALGTNGGVMIHATFGNNSSGNNKQHRVRIGGIAGSTVTTQVLTTNIVWALQRIIRNRNATNAQVASYTNALASHGSTTTATSTFTVDTTAAVDIVLSCQLANAADTGTLDLYEVWLLP